MLCVTDCVAGCIRLAIPQRAVSVILIAYFAPSEANFWKRGSFRSVSNIGSSRRSAKSERALSFADRVEGHIEWLKKERARADFQTSVEFATERLRAAYARSLADKSPAAIAALETAQADLRKFVAFRERYVDAGDTIHAITMTT
jgi:hypothetical protein